MHIWQVNSHMRQRYGPVLLCLKRGEKATWLNFYVAVWWISWSLKTKPRLNMT